ncbi:MAG: hypothetical protein ACLSTI_03895 [Ruminococcus sp.]
MTIFYNCTGTRRKELVTAISEITGAKKSTSSPTQAIKLIISQSIKTAIARPCRQRGD